MNSGNPVHLSVDSERYPWARAMVAPSPKEETLFVGDSRQRDLLRMKPGVITSQLPLVMIIPAQFAPIKRLPAGAMMTMAS
jgi:hypothetical protein